MTGTNAPVAARAEDATTGSLTGERPRLPRRHGCCMLLRFRIAAQACLFVYQLFMPSCCVMLCKLRRINEVKTAYEIAVSGGRRQPLSRSRTRSARGSRN